MSPFEQLRLLYGRHCPERSLEIDIGYYLAYHYVFATPHFVALGKPIKRGADEKLIFDVTYAFPTGDIDTWFLYAFAGRERDFLAFIPFELTWIAWQRRGSCLRYWTLDHFKQRCCNKIPCTIAGWNP